MAVKGTPVNGAKYRRLRAHGVSHREAIAQSALTPNPDFGGGGGLAEHKAWVSTITTNYSHLSQAAHTELDTAARLTFAGAVAGDVLLLIFNAISGGAAIIYGDFGVINPGTNALIRQAAAPYGLGNSDASNVTVPLQYSYPLVVEAADIVGGNVTVAPIFRTEAAAKTVYSSANYKVRFSAVRLAT